MLDDPLRRELPISPEAAALIQDDAMEGAALLDMRVNVWDDCLWLLFDCRGALREDLGNTVVMAVNKVSTMRWSGCSLQWPVWRSVMSSKLQYLGTSGVFLSVLLEPESELNVKGLAVEPFVGDVPSCDEPPPNFLTSSTRDLRSSLQGWRSDFDPSGALFID